MNNNLIRHIKDNNNSIKSLIGNIENMSIIGQGGNGLVYSGSLYESEIAIKFFVESGIKKLTRFKAEFLNIELIRESRNLVKQIAYDEITIDNEVIPFIIMKRYKGSLRGQKKENNGTQDEFISLMNFLFNTIKFIHNNGVIHRDIKPENILVEENGDFVLADFGIAYYNPEIFKLKAETNHGDRIGNYDFSPPEVSLKDVEASKNMDIYSLAQILQWYCFGRTHKGTGRTRISTIYNEYKFNIIDSIIDKCLSNDPINRFQSIEEIEEFYNCEIEKSRKINPFDDINMLNEIIRKSIPKSYNNPIFITDDNQLQRLFYNLSIADFKNDLEFIAAEGNNTITTIKYKNDYKLLLDFRLLELNGVWVYTNSNAYDDVILLDCKIIDSNSATAKAYITSQMFENEYIIEAGELGCGFVEIEGEVYDIKDLNIVEEQDNTIYKYIGIGTRFNCIVNPDCDPIFEKIVKTYPNNLSNSIICNFIDEIRKHKHQEVIYRL